MGLFRKVECNQCGNVFEFSLGGGMEFHSLFCDKCGRYLSLGFDEIKDLHMRYLKFIDMPYKFEKREEFRAYPGDPLPGNEYYQGIEDSLQQCQCGGRYRFEASPKCPKCGSDDFKSLFLAFDD